MSGPDRRTSQAALLILAGLRLRRAHRWKAALRAFEGAAEMTPTSARAWFLLAVTRDNRGQEVSAIPAYRKAIKLGLPRQERAQAWTWLASSLSKTGQPTEAATCVAKAEALHGYRPRREYQRLRRSIERRLRRSARLGAPPRAR